MHAGETLEILPSHSMDVQLTPPIGTCYFKLYTVSLYEAGYVTLSVTFYVYVTNVKPTEDDFTAKGGKVYIVVVYDGWVIGGSEKTPIIHLSLGNLTGDPTLLSCTQQLPLLGSGVKEGDYTFYTINFGQSMNMYNNGGNTGFQFSARYKKDFNLFKYEQKPFQIPPEVWGCQLAPFEKEQSFQRPTLNHLQVFEANRLAVAKVSLSFFMTGDAEPRARLSEREHASNFASLNVDSNNPLTSVVNITYDLDFSADTMARAVVGGLTEIHPSRSDGNN